MMLGVVLIWALLASAWAFAEWQERRFKDRQIASLNQLHSENAGHNSKMQGWLKGYKQDLDALKKKYNDQAAELWALESRLATVKAKARKSLEAVIADLEGT